MLKKTTHKFAEAEREIMLLRERMSSLEITVAELSNRTISGKTMIDDTVTFSQLVDEWLNGSEGSNGN